MITINIPYWIIALLTTAIINAIALFILWCVLNRRGHNA